MVLLRYSFDFVSLINTSTDEYKALNYHIADISVPTIAMSDHYPIYFTRTTAKSQFKRQNHNYFQYRSFKNFNEDNFLKDLADQLETLDISPSHTNSNFINWTSKFTDVFDKHAPVRHKRVKKETQPDWSKIYTLL